MNKRCKSVGGLGAFDQRMTCFLDMSWPSTYSTCTAADSILEVVMQDAEPEDRAAPTGSSVDVAVCDARQLQVHCTPCAIYQIVARSSGLAGCRAQQYFLDSNIARPA